MVKRYLAVYIVLMTLFLSGCGTMGTTPEKLVQQVKEMNDPTAIQKYEVNRPIAQVTATLKDRGENCMHGKVTVSVKDGYGYHSETRVYTPKVVLGKNRTRFTLQMGYERQATVIGGEDPPKDGWYIMVVDAYPSGANKTRVEGYSGSGDSVKFKAVRNWIEGTNMGCPDMTQ